MLAIILIISATIFGLSSLVFVFSLIKSRKRYTALLKPLSKEEFQVLDLLPAGLYLGEKIKISQIVPKFLKSYLILNNRKSQDAVIELYNKKYCEFYCLVYTGVKWIYAFACLIFFSLLSIMIYLQEDHSTAGFLLVMGVFISIAMPFVVDSYLKNKVSMKRLQIQLDFPDFANKLIMLLSTGMVVSNAWEKIAAENKRNTPLYKELEYSLTEIKAGIAPSEAYENMAGRCRIREIKQFIQVIISNQELGGNMIPELRKQASDCWMMRKSAAQRLGEQASTKLLIPIGLMLIGVLIIVITPAILLISQGM